MNFRDLRSKKCFGMFSARPPYYSRFLSNASLIAISFKYHHALSFGSLTIPALPVPVVSYPSSSSFNDNTLQSDISTPPLPMNAYSPVHPASLIDVSSHSPALLELLDLDLSRTLVGMCLISNSINSKSLTFSPHRIHRRLSRRHSRLCHGQTIIIISWPHPIPPPTPRQLHKLRV